MNAEFHHYHLPMSASAAAFRAGADYWPPNSAASMAVAGGRGGHGVQLINFAFRK